MKTNKLTRGLTALALASGLFGCKMPQEFPSSYEGYNVVLVKSPNDGSSTITIKDISGNELSAIDSENDGRYDTIDLSGLPKGNKLELYANPQKLQEITDKILSEVKAEKPLKLEKEGPN